MKDRRSFLMVFVLFLCFSALECQYRSRPADGTAREKKGNVEFDLSIGIFSSQNSNFEGDILREWLKKIQTSAIAKPNPQPEEDMESKLTHESEKPYEKPSDGRQIAKNKVTANSAKDNQGILHKQKKHFEGDILRADYESKIKSKSAITENRIWPDKTKIPYEIYPDIYDKGSYDTILAALKSFESKTCIKFVKHTTERDFIDIYPALNQGCASYVGKINRGGQMLSLNQGCIHPHIIKHELMHALGFHHEQSRTDRDEYVTIHDDNIIENAKVNFQTYDQVQVQLRTPYDYKSIMHYGPYDFAKDPKKPTISAKNGAKIEPADDFTETDLIDINRLYKCVPNAPTIELTNLGKHIWIYSDCYFFGHNFRQTKTKSSEECAGLCVAESKCTHFYWELEDGATCTLQTAPFTGHLPDSDPVNQLGIICGYVVRG